MEITAEAKKRLSCMIEERDAPLAPLAAKIGVSQSTLWNFIYGGTKNFSKIHRLATELKVSLDWILNGDGPVARHENKAGRISENLSGHDFKYPSAATHNDRLLVREITLAVARLVREYPRLADDAVAAIALAVWGDVKDGKLPMPQARPKSALGAIAKEMNRLAAYELSKLG